MTADTTTAPRALRPIAGRGWRLGFANMLANELMRWFGTRRWLIQLTISVLLMNGMVLIGSAMTEAVSAAEGLAEAADVFVTMLCMVMTIGAIVTVQDAIIGEKQLGTAAWVMSKPASRSGFILAKFISYGLALLLLAFPVPAVIFYAECLFFFGQVPALAALAGALGLVVLHLVFYLSLSLVLGSLFVGRGPVVAICFGLLLGGLALGNSLPLLLYVMPWWLLNLAYTVLAGLPLPPEWPIPAVATAAWSLLFLAVTLWRFSREEF